MRVVYSDRHRLHVPLHDLQGGIAFDTLEVPARAERIAETLARDPTFTIQSPTDHGLAPIEAVHAPGMIRFIEQGHSTWEGPPEMMPDTMLHPALREGMEGAGPEPVDAVGRLGYWCFDTGTPILDGTYAAARAAVDVALTATDVVLGGEPIAYGVSRPPGHHAARAVYGGFCYFNNAAIAAEAVARRTGGRVAVLDIDYHHGNGTQQIFYRRADVLYVSLHADPLRAYPYYTGFAEETGAGPGRGTTLNLPLRAGVTDAEYLSELDRALEVLGRFGAEVTVVSLGMDTFVEDPMGDFALTTDGYAECGRRIAQAAPQMVVLQEGGYAVGELGENVRQFLLGALGREGTRPGVDNI